MVKFQTEKIATVEGEIRGLINAHWEEVALNKDEIKLEPDWEIYRQLEKLGSLHILTARDNGLLIGYYVSIVKGHLHYASSKTSFSDIFYIHPLYRTGRTALRLFVEHEKAMKELGVQRIITMHKLHVNDIGALLKKLGHSHNENVYGKVLRRD